MQSRCPRLWRHSHHPRQKLPCCSCHCCGWRRPAAPLLQPAGQPGCPQSAASVQPPRRACSTPPQLPPAAAGARQNGGRRLASKQTRCNWACRPGSHSSSQCRQAPDRSPALSASPFAPSLQTAPGYSTCWPAPAAPQLLPGRRLQLRAAVLPAAHPLWQPPATRKPKSTCRGGQQAAGPDRARKAQGCMRVAGWRQEG